MSSGDKGRGRAWSEAVRERADALRRAEGAPESEMERYLEQAEELLAIEGGQQTTLKPNPQHSREQPAGAEPVEPPEALENQGDLPGLADQGEDSPQAPRQRDAGRQES